MFNRIILLCLLTATSFIVVGQSSIGIGTDSPNNSSVFEAVSLDKGVLIPRVSIADATAAAPVTSPATSLLVYNTNASITNGQGTGYYYWDGFNWVKLIDGSASDVDWYIENTINPPTAITDNIYTNGNVGIGIPLPLMSLHTVGEIQVGGNNIYNDQTGSGQNLNLVSVGGVSIILDANTNGSEEFSVKSGSITGQNVFEISEGGNFHSDGDGLISGNDLEFDGAANANIYTNSSNASLSLDIESQGGIDMVIDSDNSSTGGVFAVKRNDDGTAAVNTLMAVPENHAPLIYPYGTGTGTSGGIRFRELEANGTDNIRLRAPDALSATVNLTLPNSDGDNGELLMTDGSGILSWHDKNNIAVVKWEGAYNATGGTIASSWSTVSLNTLEGSAGFISLAANQFTLSAGSYHIDGIVPGYATGSLTVLLKSRLVNTSSAVIVHGGTGTNRVVNNDVITSDIKGIFTIASSTTFRIEQYSSATINDYYVLPSTTYGNQVRAQFTITKIE